MSLAKVQRWLSTRRSSTRRPKVKRRGKDDGATAAGGGADAAESLGLERIPRSASVGSRPGSVSLTESSSANTIQLMEFPTSPGERRRSTLISSQSSLRSDVTTTTASSRLRTFTHSGATGDRGITKVLLKLSPSMRRKREEKRQHSLRTASPSSLDRRQAQQDDSVSTASDIWKVGEVRGGIALLCTGEQIKLPDKVLNGSTQKEGYLQKHGRLFGGWKRRWCVLDVGEVSIFKTHTLTGFSGIIALDQVISINYPSLVASFGYTFEVVTKRRTFVLAAKTEDEAIHWIHLLRRASHTDKPRSSSTTRPSRFVVKRDEEITEPRSDDDLRRGLFRYDGCEEEQVLKLSNHLDSLDESSASVGSVEKPGDGGGDDNVSQSKPPVDMASEGLAIDALKAFLNCN